MSSEIGEGRGPSTTSGLAQSSDSDLGLIPDGDNWQASKGKTVWSNTENELLEELVKIHGTTSWTRIAESFPDRTGKQCRERWHNHLEHGVVKGGWAYKEDKVILSLQSTVGNQWALISKMLPGRTDNAVKNRFHAIQRARNRGKLSDSLMRIEKGVPLSEDMISAAKAVNDPQLNHELNKRLPHIFRRSYEFERSSPTTTTSASTTSLPHDFPSAAQRVADSLSSSSSSSSTTDFSSAIGSRGSNQLSSLDILALVAQISDQTENIAARAREINDSYKVSPTKGVVGTMSTSYFSEERAVNTTDIGTERW